MNCETFRQHATAYADGVLDEPLRAEADLHTRQCPTCAREAEAITAMKAALAAAWPRHTTPAAVRRQIQAAIAREAAISNQPPRRATSPWRFAAPIALAACLALFAFLRPDDQVAPQPAQDDANPTPIAFAGAVADLRIRHRTGLTTVTAPVEPALPLTPCAIERDLGRQLCLKVIVPDLTCHGLTIVAAERCEVSGRTAAHIMYRCGESGQTCSIFTIQHCAELDPCPERTRNGEPFFVSTDENPLTVVAWRKGEFTYALCAPVPAERLVSMAKPLRSACADTPLDDLLACPFSTPGPAHERLAGR